ncbi:MAG: acyl-CoA/acyl-ACP dehydrogenase [Proteobacteria bacterium]|nr:acyl-CoA/acyl-ACP dehydrogenase [Pseudomonadota bacterium]
MLKLTAEAFIEDLSAEEKTRAKLVESILPSLRQGLVEADRNGTFNQDHLQVFKETNLTGLMIPKEFGGLGGGLRDLVAACFAIGSACPSTALCFFFHCSTSSRALLALEAIQQGLFDSSEEALVRNFAHKILNRMGREKLWFGNFASESPKNEKALITISSQAKKVQGGYELSGVKSFGCSTGVADCYLVTAQLEGYADARGLATFFVRPNAVGVGERTRWDALGMRSTATHGISLDKVFVADDECLAIPAAFTRLMQVSRGSFVGNQLAGTAVYLGAAHSVYHNCLDTLLSRKFEDTGRSIAESPMHRELIGRMAMNLETASLWLRRQLQLETANPPLLSKNEVIRNWRLCKGIVSDMAFAVATDALKASGTSGTSNTGFIARGFRDLAMGLVQAFPSERGRLEAAEMIISQKQATLFGS